MSTTYTAEQNASIDAAFAEAATAILPEDLQHIRDTFEADGPEAAAALADRMSEQTVMTARMSAYGVLYVALSALAK